MSQCRRAQPTSSTTLDPPKRLSYFVICPNLTLGPFVLDLEGAKIVEQLRYKIYQKHKLLREYYDYSELVVYKPDNLTWRGDGELIDRATVSIATKDPLDRGDSELNDVFGQDSGNGLVHVIVKLQRPLSKRTVNTAPRITPHDPEYGDLAIVHNYLWKNAPHLGQIITKSSIQVPGLAVSYKLQEFETEDVTMDDTPTKDETSQSQESETEDVAMDDATANIQASFYDLMKIPNVSYLVKNVLDATFYVRDEYRELDAFVEEQRQSDIARRSRRTPILLTGQPGIGKTVYLTYCLVNRLAEGKPTVLSKSRSMRFAFLSSGVYSIPFDSFDDWVNPEVFAVIRGDLDGLSLFDLSSGESVNSLAPRWRTLVVSSPKPREVRKWVKENHVNKFYMKTWNWQEVYVSRGYAMEQRTEDNGWRIAFMRYGGSARYLLDRTQREVDRDLDSTIQGCTPTHFFQQVVTTEPEEYSHRLVEINPLQDAEGLDRSSSCTQIISHYIFTKLMEMKGSELVNASAQYFYNFMKDPSTASTAGLMFEVVGHVYVVKRARDALCIRVLEDGSEQQLHLEHIDPKVEEFSRFPFDEVHHPDATKYYRPVSGNLTGIDSFAFERDENHTITGVVMFQYTISTTRHSVKMGFIKQLWDALKNEHREMWQWKLVFVIPKDEDRKAFRKKMPTKALMTAVSQFALEIDLKDMWKTMCSSH